jgi:YjbE family integral membrane protein
MDILGSSFFWVTLGQIMMINIVLSGDNAVVIAMASRSLPPKQQRQAIFFGSFGAIALRVVLTFFAVMLLDLPWLKLVGAVLLVWIGIQMLIPEDGKDEVDAHAQLWAAIKTIVIADFIMSLDNVLGVAAAAKGSLLLLILGLALSIPLIVYGSTFILKLMNRYPAIITGGGGVLGWVAGEMAIADPAVGPVVQGSAQWLHAIAPLLGAALVIVAGTWLARANARAAAPAGMPGYALAGATVGAPVLAVMAEPAPAGTSGKAPSPAGAEGVSAAATRSAPAAAPAQEPAPARVHWAAALGRMLLNHLSYITRPRYYGRHQR